MQDKERRIEESTKGGKVDLLSHHLDLSDLQMQLN